VFGSAVLTAALTAAVVPTAHAAVDPGWDNTFIINSCPFPIEYHDATKWFKDVATPSGEVQDHFANGSTDFTNLDTPMTWHITGNVVSHWVPKPGRLAHPHHRRSVARPRPGPVRRLREDRRHLPATQLTHAI
jgi:hypothetical protein